MSSEFNADYNNLIIKTHLLHVEWKNWSHIKEAMEILEVKMGQFGVELLVYIDSE